MAIKEHIDILGAGASLQSPKDTLPKGEPIRVNELSSEIQSALKPHYSDWRFLKKSDAQGLGQAPRLRFFANDGKHWIEAPDAQTASRYTEWRAFVKPLRTPTSSGGAGPSKQTNAIDAANQLAKPFLNLDPMVSIARPVSGESLKLNDHKQFKNNLVQHTLVEGDTVASVAQQYSGSSDAGAIYNFNHPSFTPRRPPQAGDTVRVLAGRELNVDGSVQNSSQLTLSWQGPTSGSLTLDNTRGGDNETVSWQTAIPAKAGTYTLTAKASGAVSNTVTLDVIDPNTHWVKFKLLDEQGQPVEQELDYLVRFEDGTEIRSKLKEGTDYLTGVPFVPFTLELIPGDELNEKLAALRQKLRTELDTAIAQVKADSARHEKQWAKIGNVEAGFIYLGAGLTGAGEWIVDTVKGVTELATGIVNANIATYAWTGKYLGHRVDAFSSYISGDTQGLKQATQSIETMHKELGEDVSEIGEHTETLALLAWDDETRTMLVDFPGDYFSELSGVERTRAVSRYGIDFLLIFVGGVGAGALAIKNSAKISKLLNDMLEIIKQLRFQQTVKKPKVDELYEIGPPKKTTQQSTAKTAKPALVKTSKHDVPCFHPYDKKNYNAMPEADRRKYLENYNKQLQRQQDNINDMSATDYKAARDAFNKNGRNPLAESAQADMRNQFAEDVNKSIRDSLRKGGMSAKEAKTEAAKRTTALMEKLVALHEPDMVAGGWTQPEPKNMGRSDVNSSIGGSWGKSSNPNSRVAGMDAAADKAIASGKGNAKMNVKLETCRGKGLK